MNSGVLYIDLVTSMCNHSSLRRSTDGGAHPCMAAGECVLLPNGARFFIFILPSHSKLRVRGDPYVRHVERKLFLSGLITIEYWDASVSK